MIYRSRLSRTPALARCAIPQKLSPRRAFTAAPFRQQAAAAAADPKNPPVPAGSDAATTTTTATATGEPAAPSSCPAGTVLNGLNYFKGKPEPVALADHEYPEWLWSCLRTNRSSTEETPGGAPGGGDEFSKSKKQRRVAAKRQRDVEAKLVASGDLEALAPKIPLQHQSLNLPGRQGGGLGEALLAVEKRAEVKKAMRMERRRKIKEDNYLKSM